MNTEKICEEIENLETSLGSLWGIVQGGVTIPESLVNRITALSKRIEPILREN